MNDDNNTESSLGTVASAVDEADFDIMNELLIAAQTINPVLPSIPLIGSILIIENFRSEFDTMA